MFPNQPRGAPYAGLCYRFMCDPPAVRTPTQPLSHAGHSLTHTGPMRPAHTPGILSPHHAHHTPALFTVPHRPHHTPGNSPMPTPAPQGPPHTPGIHTSHAHRAGTTRRNHGRSHAATFAGHHAHHTPGLGGPIHMPGLGGLRENEPTQFPGPGLDPPPMVSLHTPHSRNLPKPYRRIRAGPIPPPRPTSDLQ
jgi:hypothetical protein